MKPLALAEPHDVLCGPFDVDPEYYIVLSNVERFYWNRPPIPAAIAKDFVDVLVGTILTVEWRCSTMARLPSLVITGTHDATRR